MSNPHAVAILANLTSWWPFDGSMSDVHGPNTFTTDLTNIAYSAGLSGQQLSPNARGYATLAAPVPIGTGSGAITIGAWYDYPVTPAAVATIGLHNGLGSSSEVFATGVDPSGRIGVTGYATDSTTYGVLDSGPPRIPYPITVQAQDSLGQIATSDQVIYVDVPSGLSGRFFMVSTYDAGVSKLYLSSELRGSDVPPAAVYHATADLMMIGRSGSPTNSSLGLEDAFLLAGYAMSQAEIAYLWDLGAGKTYAQLTADAA